jgi:NAD(P)-dependent dehydrogenase (short-subunit alcohol dehydrogenase family)
LEQIFAGKYGLILGASSGFGMAIAKTLASRGMNIFGVHFDRRSAMKQVNADIEEMKSKGVEVEYFNINAADDEKRAETIDIIQQKVGDAAPLQVLIHSLAFGSLKDYFADTPEDEITQKQLDMTIHVMANSLVYWTQDLVRAKLIARGSRIFGMTSAGGHRVWPYYGAVSAAKASLESHIRQIALELATEGVRANAICAGVTDTPALRKIPGNENLIKGAIERNPSGRMTTPQDIANVVMLLAQPESDWITGNVINVDGGEDIVG